MDWYVPITAMTQPSALLPLSVVSPLPGARQGYRAFGIVFGNVLDAMKIADVEILPYFSNVVNYEISKIEINLGATIRKWKVLMPSSLRID